MRFKSAEIAGLLVNDGDMVGSTIRKISLLQKIACAQGFSADNGPIPLRFLGYIIPVLHLVKQLPKTTVVEFYSACEGVLRANPDMPAEVVRGNASRMMGMIGCYIRKFHADLADWASVRVLKDSVMKNSRDELGIALGKLFDEARYVAMTDQNLLSFVEKRGGERALRYMVEHALYMRDPLRPLEGKDSFWLPDFIYDMQHVIMVGGPAEKIFHRLRKTLAERVGIHNRWSAHQFFTSVGNPPTYYWQKGEPSWDERNKFADIRALLWQLKNITTEYGVREAVCRDLLILLGDVAGISDFAMLTAQRRKILDAGGLNDKNLEEQLQAGWEKLRDLE